MTWLAENLGTIIVSGVLILAAVASLRHIYKTKKNGGCAGCSNNGCGCSGCGNYKEN